MVLSFVTLLASAGVGVVAASPDVDCPTPTVVADAVARRLPATSVGGDDWSVHYAWERNAGARLVTFRLLTPEGVSVLERRFPLFGDKCLAAAATIAAVVESYFLDIGWTSGAPLPPLGVARREPPSPSRAVAISREVLRLSAGAGLGIAGNAAANASLGVRLRLVGPLHVGLAMLGPPTGRSQALASGTQVQFQDWQTRVSSWLVRDGSSFEWGAGPEALIGLQTASSRGISSPVPRSRVLVAVGIGGGPCYRLRQRWRIALDVGVYRTIPLTTFTISEHGVVSDIVEPFPWRFHATLSVGYAFFN